MQTLVVVPGMDCPTEEQLVRMALGRVDGVAAVEVDLAGRRVSVTHRGDPGQVLDAVSSLGLGARHESTAPGEPPPSSARDAHAARRQHRRVLVWVLAINAAMFVIEAGAGWWARSAGLLADALDMLADATVYAIALAAVGGASAAQRRSARLSGWLQLGLAALVLAEVARRAVEGAEPQSEVMIAVGVLALLANLTCVALLSRHRRSGVHLRASWIFTTNDALANLGVIIAGQLVAATGSGWPDLVIGTAIAILVASGALRILRMPK